MKPKNLPNWSTLEHNVLSLQASDLCYLCLNTQKKISAAHAFAAQFSFYFHESEHHIFHFVGWWDLCDHYTGKWQCLVLAILYQTHFQPLEPFGKVCVQVINVPLKKRTPFNWCVHPSSWRAMYMFKSLLLNNLSIHFSHIFSLVRSWWFFPSLWNPVHASPGTWDGCSCFSTARMCSDGGNLFITSSCLLPYSALSERN